MMLIKLKKEELDNTVIAVNSVGININTAHSIELCEWNREKLAENIVNYRSENGPLKIENN
jgi:uncharacterized protein